KKYDTTQVFFELWNEPHVGAAQTIAGIDKNWWMPFQGQIIQSIREAAPEHYIIAGAENWNSWYDLTFIQPYNSKNIVYNFHFYDPYT
ncbi:cellulase family glycosylhydrolase, partial [Klebsiella pneumoniae]|uniref:cellulase family glycosylhydrolase n=1 Tax=Klebsiella pneumoniae TaxID=573 RepID=UPI003854EC90